MHSSIHPAGAPRARRVARVLYALAIALAAAPFAGADGQTLRRAPLPTHVVGRPLPQASTEPTPRPGPQHTVFGSITKLEKKLFVVRLRSGRTLDVDASDAVDSGRFSAPLFVGKVVVMTGTVDAHGIFYAQSVTRFSRIDTMTPRDR